MGSEAGKDVEAHPSNRSWRSTGEHSSELLAERGFPLSSGGESGTVQESDFRRMAKTIVWHGGSVYDAWLNASTAQVGQAILTLPTSYAQMGFKFGIAFHVFYTILGVWTSYLLARLYVEYRHRKEKEGHDFKTHVIQYHEVIESLVGSKARGAVLFFNVMTIGSLATMQIVACASNAYYLSAAMDKQQWSLVFGAISMFMVLVPSLHNFRVLSVVGLLTTTYVAWYLFISSMKHGQVAGVRHSAPNDIPQFFAGTTNVLFSSGGHAITMEIMHAMWRPRKYKYVYVFTCLYVLTITMPHCIGTYWAFGDLLLSHGNAFAVFPRSTARTLGVILMIAHQAVAYGLYVLPLFFMWEKLWGIHSAWFPLRLVMRLPVASLLWFLALALPFFGPLDGFVGATFISFSTFIIPCLAFLYVFRSSESRQNSAEKTSRFLPRGNFMAITNVLVVIVVVVFGAGLGGYASIYTIAHQVRSFGFFDKCYQCEEAGGRYGF